MGIFDFWKPKGPTLVPDCVPRALCQGAAWIYQEKKDVRFIVTKIGPGYDHIQCQVWIDGKWKWSTMYGQGRSVQVSTGDREHEGEDYKTLDWAQLLKERLHAEDLRQLAR